MMPGLFSRMRGKDGQGKTKSKKGSQGEDLTLQLSQRPRWEDAYTRAYVEPDEVCELLRYATDELKARGAFFPDLRNSPYATYYPVSLILAFPAPRSRPLPLLPLPATTPSCTYMVQRPR